MSNKIYAPVLEFKVTEGTTLLIDEVLSTMTDIAVTKVEYNEMSVALDSPTPLPDAVELGAITTVKYLFIQSDVAITVTINTTNVLPAGTVFFLHLTGATAITITNAGSTAAATVKVRLAGV